MKEEFKDQLLKQAKMERKEKIRKMVSQIIDRNEEGLRKLSKK